MVYVSTGAFSNKRPIETVAEFIAGGIYKIELSSGLPLALNIDDFIKLKKTCSFQIHNYFPPPPKPFVLNLASIDSQVSSMSIRHVETAMRWATQLDRNVYSFHAGFLIDPKVTELGKRIKKRKLLSRQEGLKIFIENIHHLSNKARKLGVELLIENNVFSQNNYLQFKTDPFLMSTPEECLFIMKNTPDNVNLLVDVAHLKVSATTLKYEPNNMMKLCDKWIKGYHLSDNDGLSDSNEPINSNSWFWPYIKKGLDYYSIEVYNSSLKNLKKLRNLVETKTSKL